MRRVHFETTDSTNVQARALAARYAGECVLVTAAEQTSGRGRQGRHWHSPRGGAWMSLAWPMRNEPRQYGAVSLVAAAAVLRAVDELVPQCADCLQVKWPNDVLLKERKVAGILCEQALDPTRKSAGTLIVGVGVNVDFDVAAMPPGLRHPPTTLRHESRRPVAVDRVIEAVAGRLTQLLTEFEASGLSASLLDELRSRLAYVGLVRSIELAGRVVTGRVAGIDSLGRLMIQGEGGETAFAAGEFIWGESDPT